MRQEVAVEAIAKSNPKDACKSDLCHNGENPNEKDNKNRSVAELHHTEGKVLCDSAGEQIGAEEDDDKFAPHFPKDERKGAVCEGGAGKHRVV